LSAELSKLTGSETNDVDRGALGEALGEALGHTPTPGVDTEQNVDRLRAVVQALLAAAGQSLNAAGFAALCETLAHGRHLN
jgi:hypothetical protein